MPIHILEAPSILKYKNKTLLIFRHDDKMPEYVNNNDNIIIIYAKDRALFDLYLESNYVTLLPVSAQYIAANVLVYVNGFFLNVRSKLNTFTYGRRYTYKDVLSLTDASDYVITDVCTKPIVQDIVIKDKPVLITNNDVTL